MAGSLLFVAGGGGTCVAPLTQGCTAPVWMSREMLVRCGSWMKCPTEDSSGVFRLEVIVRKQLFNGLLNTQSGQGCRVQGKHSLLGGWVLG